MQQLHFSGFTLCNTAEGEPPLHDDEGTDRQKGFMWHLIVKKKRGVVDSGGVGVRLFVAYGMVNHD
ncbi:hypothetical protein T08_10156 [Trichinella sp. T8]|nr:hypothetical protein T08_10156 [Trichinella sp. T8]